MAVSSIMLLQLQQPSAKLNPAQRASCRLRDIARRQSHAAVHARTTGDQQASARHESRVDTAAVAVASRATTTHHIRASHWYKHFVQLYHHVNLSVSCCMPLRALTIPTNIFVICMQLLQWRNYTAPRLRRERTNGQWTPLPLRTDWIITKHNAVKYGKIKLSKMCIKYIKQRYIDAGNASYRL